MNAVHYDEEQLIELFERGEQAVARDPHVRACRTCADTVTSIAQFSESLKSPDVWEGPELSPDPNPQVLATLRAAQQRMRTEDEHAEAQVKELLAGPRESWMPRLQEHPEWRTAGMVRKLIGGIDAAIAAMPPDALEIGSIAVAIADGFNEDRYGKIETGRLRLSAARERAYSLYIVGRYIDAQEVLEPAVAFATISSMEFDLARLRLLEALILSELEQFAEAIQVIDNSIQAFSHFNDRERRVAAQRAKGLIYFRARNFRAALQAFKSVEADVQGDTDRAGLFQNIAIAHRETGSLKDAHQYFVRALSLFQREMNFLGIAKTRWHIGRTLLSESRYSEAIQVLREVRTELSDLGVINDAAVVSVDLAHAHLLSGNVVQAVNECQELMRYFASAGLAYTEAAMTAVTFLKEAAAIGSADDGLILHVRHFLETLPRRPALSFAPPQTSALYPGG